jgi:long-chain acyl-CoA synthetase
MGSLISGGRRLAMSEFRDRAARAAAGFAALGLAPGDVVAILMRNDFAFLEATVGAQRAGLYPVPINWHNKGDEVAYVLRDCGARLLVGHADLIAAIRDAVPAGTSVLSVETPPEVACAYGIPAEACHPASGDQAWEAWLAAQDAIRAPKTGPARESIIYTSGTTGRPKGVRRFVPSDAQTAQVEAMRAMIYGFEPGMRAVVTAPMYHSAPNSYGIRVLRQADLVVLMPRFHPEELLRLVERHRLSHFFAVPTMFVRLLKLPEEVRRKYDLSSIRHIVIAGAPCPPEVKAQMMAWLGPVIHEFYGGTESGSVTYCDSREAMRKPGTVGRAIQGARVEIRRPDGSRASVGEPGEIYSRIGYFPDFTYVGKDELRQEIDSDGLITLGDIGYLDEDGYLFICDRKRDMVIVGGVNVYPAEIESALSGMPGLRDSAVFGIPHPEYGEELMAIVQPLDGQPLEPEAIRAFLAPRLADYKVPRRIEVRNELPREDSGKIFKRRLRDPYWEGSARAI